jgi:PAS domain-containing protein
MSMNLIDLAAITLAAILGASLILALLSRRSNTAPEQPVQTSSSGPIFLFEGDTLIDANPDALALIGHRAGHLTDFDAMLDALNTQFPTLSEALKNPAASLKRLYGNDDHSLWVDVDHRDETVRVALNGLREAEKPSLAEVLASDMRDAEVSLLRDVSQQTPQLIWQQSAGGKVLWANAAYSEFALGQTDTPNKAFLDLEEQTDQQGPTQRRASVKLPDGDTEQWFDVTTVPRDDAFLCFATDANAVMRADQDRRNFVQTLGKTFAQLSIGLAIFDKNRQLAMFNPALLDMTHLPVEFLSARPTIDTVLDRLRESRMMPEPKNYTSWRDRFTAVETEAKNGTYRENWALLDGQTYRVTGRPHPDGAFAFLFEDISAEVSLTRRFRSDIETGQAVLDTLPDAIAVFSASGVLVMSNHSYAKLWSTNLDILLDHRALETEIAVWQERCIPSPMWTQMRDFIQQLGQRKPWSDDAMLDDGRHLRCHANPIAGGMTMVRFAIAPPQRPVIQKLMQRQPAIQTSKL